MRVCVSWGLLLLPHLTFEYSGKVIHKSVCVYEREREIKDRELYRLLPLTDYIYPFISLTKNY